MRVKFKEQYRPIFKKMSQRKYGSSAPKVKIAGGSNSHVVKPTFAS